MNASQEAATVWNYAKSNFTFEWVSGGNDLSLMNDNINVVKIGNYQGMCQDDVLGMSIPQPYQYSTICKPGIDPEGNCYFEIKDRDMVICNGWNWFAGPPDDISSSQIDLISVLIHELGHHFGLGHSNFNGNPNSCENLTDTGAVMDTCMVGEGVTRRQLLDKNSDNIIEQGELQGIQHVYGVIPPPPVETPAEPDEENQFEKIQSSIQLILDDDSEGDKNPYDPMLKFYEWKKNNPYWPLTEKQFCIMIYMATGNLPEWCNKKGYIY